MNFGKLPPSLPNAPNIPIIGEPFSIKDWYPTVLLVCNCEGKVPVIVSRALGQCSVCKKQYAIQGIQLTPQGQVNFQMAIGLPTGLEPGVKEN